MRKIKHTEVILTLPALAAGGASGTVEDTLVFPEPAIIIGYKFTQRWGNVAMNAEGHIRWWEGAKANIAQRGAETFHVIGDGGVASSYIYEYSAQDWVWFPIDCRPSIKEDGVITVEFYALNNHATLPNNFDATCEFLYYEV